MKKILLTFILILAGCMSYGFDETQPPIDFQTLTTKEQTEYIKSIKPIIFSKDFKQKIETAEFKKLVKEHKKDKNYPENYYAAQSGYKFYKNNYLTANFIKMDIMSTYTLQEKNNLRIIYTYTILGNLKNIDIIYDNYPNYPYYSRKYSKSGNIISTSYFTDKKNEIIFNADGSTIKVNKR